MINYLNKCHTYNWINLKVKRKKKECFVYYIYKKAISSVEIVSSVF